VILNFIAASYGYDPHLHEKVEVIGELVIPH